MNKAEMADRLAARIGLNKGRRKGRGRRRVRDDRRGSGEWRGGADRGLRDVRCQDPGGPYGPQPPDRRGDLDIGFEVTVVQGGEGSQGCGERRTKAVTVG